uniref:P-loop containing nucleoside triphosphate hydrolase protein n=1 Tax=Psilocybe cubensis TaxID=181762 RepID=A0A8H8CG88_PSICU
MDYAYWGGQKVIEEPHVYSAVLQKWGILAMNDSLAIPAILTISIICFQAIQHLSRGFGAVHLSGRNANGQHLTPTPAVNPATLQYLRQQSKDNAGLVTFGDIWPLATYTQQPKDWPQDEFLWIKLAILSFTAWFIPLFVPRRYVPVNPEDPMPEPNNEQTCSIFSLGLFSYLDPVVSLGSRVEHLEASKLPPLSDTDFSRNLVAKAFPYLDVYSGAKKRHLFIGLMSVFRYEYSVMALSVIGQVVAGFLSPIGINRILSYIENGGEGATIRPWFWILCLFCGPSFDSILFQWYIFLATRTLTHTEALMTQLIFEHSLRVRFTADSSEEVKPKITTDQDQTGVNTDSSEGLEPAAPAEQADAVSATPGAPPGIPVLSPLNQSDANDEASSSKKESHFIGKINNLVTTDLGNVIDARDFLFVVIAVLKMVKLFGWEQELAKKIDNKREEELSAIWRYKTFSIFTRFFNVFIPTATMVATYATYTMVMKRSLTPSIIFSSLTVFTMIRNQLFQINSQLSTSIQGKVSLDRISDFLCNTELLDSFENSIVIDNPLPESEEIGFRKASFSWRVGSNDSAPTSVHNQYRLEIKDELLFKPNCINLIVGPTGSGKTSILMALLGEMHFIKSGLDAWFNLPRSGGVAYAAQESWVQNDTIKDNILFGSAYDEVRYKKVLYQCALERDLNLFEAGDATEVGERGITLSGGQKARITLARAIYSQAKVLLLDDILAALDVHTTVWIVNKCFNGDLVQDRTILLVTHNIALLAPISGFIVSLGHDGAIVTQGTDFKNGFSQESALRNEFIDNSEDVWNQETDMTIDEKEIASSGKLVVAEEIATGHITWKSFKLYLSALAGDNPVAFFSVFLGGFLALNCVNGFQVWFLGYWGSKYENHNPQDVSVSLYLSLYCAIVFMGLAFNILSNLFYVFGVIQALRKISSVLMTSILTCTLRWLDKTPTSRIIARCTQDIRIIDGELPEEFRDLVRVTISLLVNLGGVVIFTPSFFLPGMAVAALGLYLGNLYLKASLPVRRERSNARAPVLAHFTAAISGIVSIRAYGAQANFKAESMRRIDLYTRISRISFNLNRWIGIRADILGSMFTVALASYLVYGNFIGSSNTGFSLTMAVDFCSTILFWVRVFNDLELQSNSLERVQHYIDIEHEPLPTKEGLPPATWPKSGDLIVENLSARYSEACGYIFDGPKVLHGLSFNIESGKRVGIVGRTGSGKSSLTLALLRCILTEGTVYYDGLPTNRINLDALRSNITIIPQSPELITGSLRQNLDPFEQYDDATLYEALRSAGLFSIRNEGADRTISLDNQVSMGGGNLSVGERQIVALARAMVRGSKLLILDEATSAIDYKTDAIIQETLRQKLNKDTTVITVAHRLQTIMDADKILSDADIFAQRQLEAEVSRRWSLTKAVLEFDTPSVLLQKEGGMFKALVDESSDKADLYAMVDQQCNLRL